MERMPVTLADQGIFIEPEDADELTDLLADAARVIGQLAAVPAAEEACARAPARAAAPSWPWTCGWPPPAWTRPRPPARKTPAWPPAPAKQPDRAGNARDTPRKRNTPGKGSDKVNALARQPGTADNSIRARQ